MAGEAPTCVVSAKQNLLEGKRHFTTHKQGMVQRGEPRFSETPWNGRWLSSTLAAFEPSLKYHLRPQQIMFFSVPFMVTLRHIPRPDIQTLPIPGPFLLLENFDIDVVRMCSMHNVNLGLLFTCNGSSLLLVFPYMFCGKVWKSTRINHTCWLETAGMAIPRMACRSCSGEPMWISWPGQKKKRSGPRRECSSTDWQPGSNFVCCFCCCTLVFLQLRNFNTQPTHMSQSR